jgi:hypothetical protein
MRFGIIFCSQTVFATSDTSTSTSGISQLSELMMQNVATYLQRRDTQALFSSSRSIETLARKLFLNQVTTDTHFDRYSSRKLIYSPSLRAKIEERFSHLSIYPITLTFQQDDVPLLNRLDVFSFISRVQTVVFEGDDRLVIEAKKSESETREERNGNIWSLIMYDPRFWVWDEPDSLMNVLHSDSVAVVKSIELGTERANLVIELLRSVTKGDINWTTTKTTCLHDVWLEGNTVKELFLLTFEP